ncbi:MAG: hypothetical protein GY768_21700 [Planctomycetaceae bacterium]|nr:hypothetical protein [Planctomycetaceae bacterium]
MKLVLSNVKEAERPGRFAERSHDFALFLFILASSREDIGLLGRRVGAMGSIPQSDGRNRAAWLVARSHEKQQR